MSFRIYLPQEMVKEVIDQLSHNDDLAACSLVSRSWGYPARKRLFHHICIYPEEVDDWLSRPHESIERMAPHIVKLELTDHSTSAPRTPPFFWEGSGLLTLLISSLATSPVRWLSIRTFDVVGFNKTTLEQCFEPIAHSLRSLVLHNLVTCPGATRYLISLFPNLEDLHTGNISSTSAQLASRWVGCGTKHSPKLCGTLEFYSAVSKGDAELLAGIVSLSPRFRVISPVEVTTSNWGAMRGLMEACAGTLESVPLVSWGFYVESVPPGLFSSCKKLREVGFTVWDGYRCTRVHEMLSSIRSKHLSTITLHLAFSNRFLSDCAWEVFCRWWGDLEHTLCHLADRRLANSRSPLVLKIIWERRAGHKGNCGMEHPDTILSRFREKGSIQFVEGDPSCCKRCAKILVEGSQARGD